MDLFLSPHNDDESLFGAFIIQQNRPQVLIVFDSYVQVARGHTDCSWQQRREETGRAMNELNVPGPWYFLGRRDDTPVEALPLALEFRKWWDEEFGHGEPNPKNVWLPLPHPYGHPQHNLVTDAGARAFPDSQHFFYGTYSSLGKMDECSNPPGYVKGFKVLPRADQVKRKLRALACYDSQLGVDNCRPHFLRDLEEYLYGRS